MIRIISGLDEGELVLQAPPLKAAAVEPGLEMVGIESSGTSDDLKRRINEKLEQTNGTEVRGPAVMPSQGFGEQQGGDRERGTGGIGPGRDRSGRPGFESMTAEQREEMRKRFESMSPEEREKMRQRFQGTGPRRGGEGRRQGGGPRPQGSGRD